MNEAELKLKIVRLVNSLLGPVGNTIPAKNVGPAHPIIEKIIKTVRESR